MTSQYSRYGSRSGKKKKKEITATPEMKKLVPTSRICINAEGDTIFVYNGKTRPVTAEIAGEDLLATTKVLKPKIMHTFHIREDAVVEWCGLLNDEILKLLESPDSEDEDEQEKKICTYKYSVGIPLAESVLVGDIPMLLQVIDGKVELSKEIAISGNRLLIPIETTTQDKISYSFLSQEEITTYVERAKKETPDSLFLKIESEWKKYIDANDHHITICAADTYFTYFQDILGMTHYLLFIGDNDVGKSSNLEVFKELSYRPLYDVSITAANIYRNYGGVEEGQITILEDEIDNIDEQDEKMKICKVGYKTGTKVSRSDDTSSGRKTQKFYTYGFKAFTSEKQPDSIKAKGFNERVFVVKCSAGDPTYDICEVTNPAGDEEYKIQLDGLDDLRKLLFAYRLLHHSDPIPNVKLNIKNRDKQLCKPLIRLYHGTDNENKILDSLSALLAEKKERKANTIDAKLYYVVIGLIEGEDKNQQNQTVLDSDLVFLKTSPIWETFMKEVDGVNPPHKLQSMETVEFGSISQKQIASILKDKFGGESGKQNGERGFKFSRIILKKLGRNYSKFEKIKILDEPVNEAQDTSTNQPQNKSTVDALDALDASTENTAFSETPKTMENGNNPNSPSEKIQENGIIDVNISNQIDAKKSEHSHNVSEASNPSTESQEPSQCEGEEPKLRQIPEMPEEIEDDQDAISENELEPFQKPPKESYNPIVSPEDFFRDGELLPSHSLEESPCFHITNVRRGEIATDIVYYCELHPDLGSTFLSQIELHCRTLEPESHKAAILEKEGEY